MVWKNVVRDRFEARRLSRRGNWVPAGRQGGQDKKGVKKHAALRGRLSGRREYFRMLWTERFSLLLSVTWAGAVTLALIGLAIWWWLARG